MTEPQRYRVWHILAEIPEPFRVHHGDCIGADAQFDALARSCALFDGATMYPSVVPGKRAFCRAETNDIVHRPADPLLRNERIARVADLLLATPKEPNMVIHSGTWSTIRAARRFDTTAIIVQPAGGVYVEGETPAWLAALLARGVNMPTWSGVVPPCKRTF